MDKEGNLISGYAAADCNPIRSDGLRQSVRWKKRAGLDELSGKAIRLRFLLREGDLYAFTFESGNQNKPTQAGSR
ncbi:MAG: hypothetical protein L0338_13850 [Acidobacteria bacterium]|nr:hypothetical protein [Acidobacteriota bacterium]